jgi:nicotinate phosphoribosyltransferase
VSFALAYPNNFLSLVDTYDTLNSGVPNFLCVALALNKLGYKPAGIRLDSGDLAFLSVEARQMFDQIGARYNINLNHLKIVASNDINESVIHALNQQGHKITVYGIGTNLVTCQSQPALGMVYKLVEVRG